jgi:hypothetical protein
MRIGCIVALIVASSAPALAQAHATQSVQPRLIISERAMAIGLEQAPPQVQSRDSLKNGAIIGALIGFASLAAPGGWICHMLKEPGDPPCWKGAVTVGAIGAGIGAAVGAGIDAIVKRDSRSVPYRQIGNGARH